MKLIKYIKRLYLLYKIKKKYKPKYKIGEPVRVDVRKGSARLVKVVGIEYTQIYTNPIILYKVQEWCLYEEGLLYESMVKNED